MTAGGEWEVARRQLEARISSCEQFPELVRCYGGNPRREVPSRRARRLALRICETLGLDPAVYIGNVYGAASARIEARAS